MRIGTICRMDRTGLGIQSIEFFNNIPCKALVIDVSGITNTIPQHPEWYPGQTICRIARMGVIPQQVMEEFIKDIDVLITFENPYDYSLFSICRAKGVKTILQLNYEFLEYPSKYPPPDLFLAPSLWHYSEISEPKAFLTVPVNTNNFVPQRKKNTFIHIEGRKAAHDRNGTQSFLRSLAHIKNDVTVILRSQQHFTISDLSLPSNVTLITEFANKPNYYDNYTGGVLVMPRRYGGLSLVVNEALAAEMPVIMTDISPNNTWLPKEWLVPANLAGTFRCKKQVDYYEADTKALAEKIDQFCDEDFYAEAVNKTQFLKGVISWDTLKDKYYELFERVLNENK